MTLIFLLLSIILSSVRNILSKEISDLSFGKKQFFVIQSCIFACGSLILISITKHPFTVTSLITNIYIVIYSILLLSAQYCYTMAMKKGNIGICSIVYSLGFIFPTLSGSLFWNEKLTMINIFGILMVIPTVILSGRPERKNEKTNNTYFIPLIIAMLSSGGLGIVQKAQQNSPYPDQRNSFVILAFALAAVISFFISLFAKSEQKKHGKKLIWGSGIGAAFGICNLLNTILAGKLDSVIFFPVLNISTILFSTLAGVTLYKEKLSGKNLIVLLMGSLSILLITAT